MISGRLHFTALALDPIHHGAGVSGNTTVLRKQDVILPDGTTARVPFISGNSLKHKIRESAASFALQAMGVDRGLTKAQVDLLYSGGSLSKGGSSVNLSQARQLEELFPVVSLCGYSAGNTMTSSKLTVEHLHLVCAENRHRMHAELANEIGDALASRRAGQYLGEDFGTRHEHKNPAVMRLLTYDERKRIEGEKSKKKDEAHADKGDSLQMIYEFETIKPGALFFGCIHFRDVSDMELAALQSALGFACEGQTEDGRMIYTIGAKSSIGFGRVAIRWIGQLRADIRPPEFADAEALTRFDGSVRINAYVEHLRTNKDAIMRVIADAVK